MELNIHKDVKMLRCRGLSLIELLVALVLISITVLGTVRLQVASQGQLDYALYSGQALELIEETSRRIHLNYSNHLDYQVTNLERVKPFKCDPCSPADLVKLDLTHLSQNLFAVLPDASASIFKCQDQMCMAVAWAGESFKNCQNTKFCIERALL